MGPGPSCGMGMLMHAPPDVLKSQLKLSDAQVTSIEAIRTNVLTKRITLKAEIQKLQLKNRKLMQADLPDERQVLTAMRKGRALRGKLQEEHAKGQIKILAALTKEQRTELRAKCPMGWGLGQPGGGWGKGGRGRGRGGHGRGWGGGF